MATTEHNLDVVNSQPTSVGPPRVEAQIITTLYKLQHAVTGPSHDQPHQCQPESVIGRYPDPPPDYPDIHQLQVPPLPTVVAGTSVQDSCFHPSASPSRRQRQASIELGRTPVSPRSTNPQWQYYEELPRTHPLNIWHGCCYAEDAENMSWLDPSKKGPLRALCLVLLDTIIVLLCLLLLTPIILFLPVIAIFWILGVCCVGCCTALCTDGDDFCEDFCEDFGEDAWESDDDTCCILAPCNKGFLCTVTVLLAWSIICPCPPGFATVVCLGMYCLYNRIRHGS